MALNLPLQIKKSINQLLLLQKSVKNDSFSVKFYKMFNLIYWVVITNQLYVWLFHGRLVVINNYVLSLLIVFTLFDWN